MPRPYVLLSWVARNNDPYERLRGSLEYRLEDGETIPGPTLTLLFDEDSPYEGMVSDVFLLTMLPSGKAEAKHDKTVLEQTKEAIEERSRGKTKVVSGSWQHDDPTDHVAIYRFLKSRIPQIRQKYPGKKLLIHASPGTPAMQTIWILMAETGQISDPYQVVKSIERRHRKSGAPAVARLSLDLDTLLKVHKQAKPRVQPEEDEGFFWDPSKFQSEALKKVYSDAKRFAATKIPILILGERGTGKTTLAQWIRLNSSYRVEKRDSSWANVPCGQYVKETMRSELFGYVKGAFTGAVGDHAGLLAAADKDTLFLDEIGDVSRDVQRLLIRAVESGEYQRLGEAKIQKSDFRLITATNLPPVRLEERLDRDFFDRISHLVLQLPPLRELGDDLDWLWRDVYEQASLRAGIDPGLSILDEEEHVRIVTPLLAEALPGNVRDLYRVAYRVIIAVSGLDGPSGRDGAIEQAVAAGLESPLAAPVVGSDQGTAILRAYLEGMGLDAVLDEAGPLDVKGLVADLKKYVALKLKEIARVRQVSVEELFDGSESTIRNWLKG